MSNKKKIKEKWSSLSHISKIQFISASVMTAFLLAAVPVFAWFTIGNDYEMLTKVQEPDRMNIRAGNDDPIVNFDLSGIDIEAIKKNGSQGIVFGVKSGKYKTPYDLQLAHTTNIPLKYTIYTATKVTGDVDANNVPSNYVPYKKKVGGDGTITYYQYGNDVGLEEKNIDPNSKTQYGRNLAANSGKFYDNTYTTGSNADTPELYAIPIYMRTTASITPAVNEDIDYFILKLEWDGNKGGQNEGSQNEENQTKKFFKWNEAANNKETDIIYITASRRG